MKKEIRSKLSDEGLDGFDNIIEDLLKYGFATNLEHYYPLMREESGRNIIQIIASMANTYSTFYNMTKASLKMGKIIASLKNYSFKKDPDLYEELNLVEEVETVINLYFTSIKHGVEVIKNYSLDDQFFVYGNSDKLGQIWTNLINNAIYAMEKQGTLTIGIEKKDNFVYLSIADSGKGIPKDIIEKIFAIMIKKIKK